MEGGGGIQVHNSLLQSIRWNIIHVNTHELPSVGILVIRILTFSSLIYLKIYSFPIIDVILLLVMNVVTNDILVIVSRLWDPVCIYV